MPIIAVAIAEIVLAGFAAVWLTVQEGADWSMLFAFLMLFLSALNAIGVLRLARRDHVSGVGLWLALLGGLFLLTIGTVALWSSWVFPWDGSLIGLVASFGLTSRMLDFLIIAAGAALFTGWGVDLFHRWRRGRRPA